jgi:hypothetical protein
MPTNDEDKICHIQIRTIQTHQNTRRNSAKFTMTRPIAPTVNALSRSIENKGPLIDVTVRNVPRSAEDDSNG